MSTVNKSVLSIAINNVAHDAINQTRVYDRESIWKGIAERFNSGEIASSIVKLALDDINQFMREAHENNDSEWGDDARVRGSKAYWLTGAFRSLALPLEASGAKDKDGNVKRIPWDKLDKETKARISQVIKNRISLIKTTFLNKETLQFFNHESQKKAQAIDLMTGELKATDGKSGGTPRKQTTKACGYWFAKGLQAEGALLVMQKLDILISELDQEAIDDFDSTKARDLLIEACVMAKHLTADDATALKETLTQTEGSADDK